jgi:hypothetical protein
MGVASLIFMHLTAPWGSLRLFCIRLDFYTSPSSASKS